MENNSRIFLEALAKHPLVLSLCLLPTCNQEGESYATAIAVSGSVMGQPCPASKVLALSFNITDFITFTMRHGTLLLLAAIAVFAHATGAAGALDPIRHEDYTSMSCDGTSIVGEIPQLTCLPGVNGTSQMFACAELPKAKSTSLTIWSDNLCSQPIENSSAECGVCLPDGDRAGQFMLLDRCSQGQGLLLRRACDASCLRCGSELWVNQTGPGSCVKAYFSSVYYSIRSIQPNPKIVRMLKFNSTNCNRTSGWTTYTLPDSRCLGNVRFFCPHRPTPVPTPTPPPPPSPQRTLVQLTCNDSACVSSCKKGEFSTGKCLRLWNGGSAIAQCNSTEVSLTMFSGSATCGGSSITTQMPTNQCLRNAEGGFLENFCLKQRQLSHPVAHTAQLPHDAEAAIHVAASL